MRRSPWFSRIARALPPVVLAASLCACGGAAAGSPASAPVEVVIASESSLPAPSARAVASGEAESPEVKEGDGEAGVPKKSTALANLELELSDLNIATLSALSGSGSSVIMGGQPGSSSLLLGGSAVVGGPLSGPAQSGMGGGGLAGIGGVVGGVPGGLGGGSATAVKGPVASATVAVVAGSGDVPDAARMGAGMTPGFRRCYAKGLTQDPTMQGTIALIGDIAADGSVGNVLTAGGNGLSGEVRACLVMRFRAAQFAAPPKGKATLRFKVDLKAN